jgi:hypothetical protein
MAYLDDGFEQFLRQNPGFNLLQFDFRRPGATDSLNFEGMDPEAAITSLKTFRRLLRLYPSQAVAAALAGAGLRSAHQVAALGEQRFVREYAGLLADLDGVVGGAELARAVHRQAENIVERVRLDAMNVVALADPVYALIIPFTGGLQWPPTTS